MDSSTAAGVKSNVATDIESLVDIVPADQPAFDMRIFDQLIIEALTTTSPNIESSIETLQSEIHTLINGIKTDTSTNN
ncbi:hypothetical protein [Candidatus Epulonipiscium viviparus]|uniref:hypothetical protein n=1 Tax=Candidatus Epulonipiscium viviparus TaxID=420336 RepID=UPI00273809CC|nr:hypothetical protein [Candidatus Epulopiscium viviparus]